MLRILAVKTLIATPPVRYSYATLYAQGNRHAAITIFNIASRRRVWELVCVMAGLLADATGFVAASVLEQNDADLDSGRLRTCRLTVDR